MKVYLLTTGDGSDGDAWALLSIHATMESAEAARAEYQKPRFRHDGSSYISYTNDIEEWEVEGAYPSQWISVDDRMPKRDTPILCCWSPQLRGMGVARVGAFAGAMAWREIGGQDEVDEPIAWMPLPEPPTALPSMG